MQKDGIVAESSGPAKAGSRAEVPRRKYPIRQAEFLLSVAEDAQLPPPGPPEIAFAGRSNAGKSSAINALANRTRLAFTSKTPGRTQQINFFRLASGAMLADLPGYGYAAVPQALKRHWQEFLARYLATRQSLVGLVLVIDARHGLSELDGQLLGGYLTSGRPVLVLATKMDKFTPSAQRVAQRAIERDIAAAFPVHAAQVAVVGFSATRRIGIEAAEAMLSDWLGESGFDRVAVVSADTKEKAPRSRGMARGPKDPR
ncbi:MAG: ribosome biogenesis GTP-binding protein YihA/YsxC [Betaproteobacteria bacterium]